MTNNQGIWNGHSATTVIHRSDGSSVNLIHFDFIMSSQYSLYYSSTLYQGTIFQS